MEMDLLGFVLSFLSKFIGMIYLEFNFPNKWAA